MIKVSVSISICSALCMLSGVVPRSSAIDFERQVLPMLQEKCWGCHSGRVEEPSAGLLLDTPEHIMAGSEYGRVIVKMLPEESLLVERIALPEKKRGRMPPAGKGEPCTPEQIRMIRAWIQEGANFGEWRGYKKPKREYQPKKSSGNSPLSLGNYGKNHENPGLSLDPMPVHKPRITASLIKAKAAKIDRMVAEFRFASGAVYPGPANDLIFLRRAYLGIAGRTPALGEALAFFSSKRPNKRAALIDELINSEGYVSNWFHFWADLLKVDSVKRNIPSVYYADWIKRALRSNMPYDTMAFALITATGMPHQNGATGWTASDENMKPDHMANTLQVFMGMQLQCAQCHDHPFDRWNQFEFQSMVSYYGGVRYNGINNRYFMNQIEKAGLAETLSDKQARFFRNLGNRYRLSVWEPSFTRWHQLPSDYQYADARPRQALRPQVPFGQPPHIANSPRETFGRWITSKENEYFSKTLSNRLWKELMGVGLIEPTDTIKFDTMATIPPLMDFLEKTMKELNYNLKDFLRILYNTKTWQMDTRATDLPEDLRTYVYDGRPLVRMSGEQIWDSLVALAIQDPDDRKGHGSKWVTDEYRQYLEKIYTMPIQDVVALHTDKFIDQERQDQRMRMKAAYKTYLTSSNGERIREMKSYRANYNSWTTGHMVDPRWRGMDRGLVRAAELSSPAPAYHFVRQFGQSDRKTINTGRLDPNVTQVLSLLNGPIHAVLDGENSLLARHIHAKKTTKERIRTMFRSILTRNPTEEEIDIAASALAANPGREGLRMVLWALLNTREFIFIQ